jgi:Fumarylacetoacetate (FAA) hydrolase family
MKLLRYGPPGREKPAVLAADGKVHDWSGIVTDVSGEFLLPGWIGKLLNTDLSARPIVPGRPRIGHGVGSVEKFICIGLNYSDHAKQAGMALPTEPVIFMKATSSICGPDDNVVIPRGSRKRTGKLNSAWSSASRASAWKKRMPTHRCGLRDQ